LLKRNLLHAISYKGFYPLNMKKIIYLSFFAMLLSLSVSAQHAIRANHVINHIGQQVVVVDSIYNIKIYNDSTAVMVLGENGTKTPVNVVFNFNSKLKFDPDMLKTLKGSIVEVSGMPVLISNEPTIVLTERKNVYFFSSSANQNWSVLSQLSYKKN
jgi:hypothetical protein